MKLTLSKPNAQSGTVLIIGDSISLGATDVRGNDVVETLDRGYVDILREQCPSVQFNVDAGVHRSTISVRQRIAALVTEHQADVVLLMIGGNDATLDWKRFLLTNGKTVRSNVPVDRFQENLSDIVRQIREGGAVPVICDLPVMCVRVRADYLSQLSGKDLAPLFESGGGQAEVDRQHDIYATAASAVADQHDVPMARFSHIMYQLGPSAVVSPDGIHSNAKAHEIIADAVQPVLADVLQQAARFRRRSMAV